MAPDPAAPCNVIVPTSRLMCEARIGGRSRIGSAAVPRHTMHEPGVEISRTGIPSSALNVKSAKTAPAWSYRVTVPAAAPVTNSMSARIRSTAPRRGEVAYRVSNLRHHRHKAAIQPVGHLKHNLVDARAATRASLVGYRRRLSADIQLQADRNVRGLRRIHV